MIIIIKQINVTKFDEITGEVFSDTTKQSNSKLWIDGKGAIIKHKTYHKKIYSDIRLCDYISDKADLLKTYILVEYIYKNTNIIQVSANSRNIRPATDEDIANILEISTKKSREYLRRMIKKGILGELILRINDEEYKSYVFNPIFVNSCKYISNEIYLLFKPYLDKYFPQWIKDKYQQINNKK